MKTPESFAGAALLMALAASALGVLTPRVSAAPQSPTATTNRVLTLDGNTGSMLVPDCPAFHTISNAITLEAWCRARSFYPTRGSVNSLIRKNVAAEAENFFLRIRSTDALPLVEFGLGSKLATLRAPAELKTNEWFHLAGTYDGRTATLYLNGTVLASQPVLGNLAIDTSELFIGKGDPEYSYGEFFDGMLDEVRIWNLARSSAEIQATLHKPLIGKERGLVACWNFDNGTAKDLAGSTKPRLETGAQIQAAERPLTLTPRKNQSSPTPKPGRASLTPDKRVEVLEALWKNLSEIYPALEYKGIRGREWMEPALRRASEVKTDDEFYSLVREQMAGLNDTHTRVLSYPGQPRLESPPVLLQQVDGKVAVIRAQPTTALAPGDVIMSIDDRPVEACLAEQLKVVCNSTERGRIREACEQLLRGAPGTAVNVTVRSGTASRRVSLRREAVPDFWNEAAISSRSLENSIGYIRISRWTDGKIPQEFDRALEHFKETLGLVIDVRGNGGGNDQLADVVNGRLLKKAVVSSIDFWRQAGTDQYHRTVGWVEPRGPWTYEGRVAVLIDEASTSACEHFVSGIEAMERVLLVGQPTNGAGGGPTSVTLPDGTRIAISRALGIRANGVVFEGHGIPPHLYASPSLDDLRAGRDPALELAREWIKSGRELPLRTQQLPGLPHPVVGSQESSG